jgi:ribose transport system permease protein
LSTPATPADEVEAEELLEEEPEPWWQRLVTGSSTSIALILVGLVVVFSFLKFEEFFDVNNARNIATDAAVLLVLAVGLTFIIITAGIDLSVGAVLVFAGVVAAKVMNEMGGDNWGVILVGLAAALASGLAWGVLNGFLVAKAKIPAFIVTLGTLGMALGSALLITGGVDQRDVPFKLIDTVGSGRAFGEIPYLVLIAAAVALVFGIILAGTRFGRYTYAIGSNEEGVRRAGVAVDAHLIKVYALGGTLAGLAGFMSLARFGTTTIGGHSTDNLDAIAAIVIGGTSLFGGKGSVVGAVFGSWLMGMLNNGLILMGFTVAEQMIARGIILIMAVAISLREARP